MFNNYPQKFLIRVLGTPTAAYILLVLSFTLMPQLKFGIIDIVFVIVLNWLYHNTIEK